MDDDTIISVNSDEDHYVECKHCQGSGSVTARYHMNCCATNTDGYPDINELAICSVCGGTGRARLR